MRGYYFGPPSPPIEQTIRGEKDDAAVYIAVETRIRLLVRVDVPRAQPGGELDPDDWEPSLRERIADAMLGISVDDMTVDCAAVEAFSNGEPT